jgi:hypothetical protein
VEACWPAAHAGIASAGTPVCQKEKHGMTLSVSCPQTKTPPISLISRIKIFQIREISEIRGVFVFLFF